MPTLKTPCYWALNSRMHTLVAPISKTPPSSLKIKLMTHVGRRKFFLRAGRHRRVLAVSGPLWNLNELLPRSLEQVPSPFLQTVGRILDFDPIPYVGIVLAPAVCSFAHDPFQIQLTG